MIYKNTSIKRVIAKVFTDLDLKEGDHRVSDMIGWAGEALVKIGAFPYFETRVAGKEGDPLLEIVNYQAKLPGGFHRLIQVGYSTTEAGSYYPMRQASGSFERNFGLTSAESAASTDLSAVAESDIVILAMNLYDLDYAAALAKINNEPATRDNLAGYIAVARETSINKLAEGGTTTTTDYIYTITPGGWIKTNQSTGYLMVAYQAIPLDENGYPMVPDDESFMEALYWYISMKLMYPEWKQGRIRDAVYYDARRSWNFCCKQAYGNAMMPNIDQLESIKNTWLSLVPRVADEHDSFYSNTGAKQTILNAHD